MTDLRAELARLRRLRTRGFAPLKPGHIHLRCPGCGRKQSNSARAKYDHPTAFLAEVCCERCCQGHMGCGGVFFDRRGRQLSGRFIERIDG